MTIYIRRFFICWYSVMNVSPSTTIRHLRGEIYNNPTTVSLVTAMVMPLLVSTMPALMLFLKFGQMEVAVCVWIVRTIQRDDFVKGAKMVSSGLLARASLIKMCVQHVPAILMGLWMLLVSAKRQVQNSEFKAINSIVSVFPCAIFFSFFFFYFTMHT